MRNGRWRQGAIQSKILEGGCMGEGPGKNDVLGFYNWVARPSRWVLKVAREEDCATSRGKPFHSLMADGKKE